MLDALRLFATAAVLVAVAACQGRAPSPTPSPSPSGSQGTSSPAPSSELPSDASAKVHLGGFPSIGPGSSPTDFSVEFQNGTCIWYEAEGKLVVEFELNAAGDYFKLTAPLAWTGDELPPGAASAEPELELRIGGDAWDINNSLLGEMANDASSGTFSGLAHARAGFTGEFECPTVIDG